MTHSNSNHLNPSETFEMSLRGGGGVSVHKYGKYSSFIYSSGAWVTIYYIVPLFGHSTFVLHCIECIVAGIMSAVSFLELIPQANDQKRPSARNWGMVAGAIVMLLTNLVV